MNKLGEYLSIKHGWAFKGEFFSEQGIQSILTPGNFFEKGGFKENNGKERYYTGEYPPEYLCSKGDLIVAMTEQASGLLGSTAIVPDDKKYLHNQRIGLIECNEERLLKIYAYYLFMTKSVREQISRSSSGTKVKHTSPEKIYDVVVRLRDIPSQKKISELLWSIDSKIQLNNKINETLQEQTSLLYDYWFTQFDFPDENGEPYKSSGGKMVWNEQLKREIPEGWIVKPVSELLNVVTGKEDANFSVIKGKYKFFTCSKDALLCDEHAFDGKAILIAGNGDFNVKHYSGKFNAYQRTYVLIPENEKYYGTIYLAASRLINMFKTGSNGSIVKFITKDDVDNIMITIPNNDTYFEVINHIITTIESKQRENEELSALRDWLLPMLMNGQVTME